MVVFPVLKLGTLTLRTLAKPIANRLKKDAGLHPKFRQFILNIAQAHHRFSTTMQRRVYGRSTEIEIRPLDEERAIQSASDILGEVFLFSVAGLAVIYEVQRNSRAEARKEELRKQEQEASKKKDEAFATEVENLKLRLEKLERRSFLDTFKFWNAKEKQAL
ncbi:OPA3-like protein [Rhododendron vialii]|uniref:OPA3-like protein n=1 Tax=Rhododendron vialii TaxID=182163 RepID=UPI00265EDE13|nr:OPA3-like protein [Rhododendron vialii]